MAKMGRPVKPPEERTRTVGINLAPVTIEALRELAELRGVSQGVLIGNLVLPALKRERAKKSA
jgi:hypothetical protein